MTDRTASPASLPVPLPRPATAEVVTDPEVIDLFAGPGGWDTGASWLGLNDILGIEWDDAACETAVAAGHRRLQADVALLRPSDIVGAILRGLIASPPCQGFSLAGKSRGRRDSERIIAAVSEFASGRDPRDDLATEVEDARSVLALEPLRWALELEPEWMAWEQVPAVLPLWEACAEALRADGYEVYTGLVHAEQYGVPQTRKRAILAARRGALLMPTPTHSRYYARSPERLDPGVEKWVSMAEAIGRGMTHRPSMTVTGGGTASGGAEPFGNAARQGMLRELDAGRWVYRNGNQAHSARRTLDQPAPTVHFAARMNLVEWEWEPTPANAGDTAEDCSWVHSRPSPTIVGSFKPEVVAAPGWRKAGDGPRQNAKGSVRVSVQEAAVLQGFPVDYPWQGSKTAQYRQVGDAVPPLLAAHVLSSVTGIALGGEHAESVA